MKLTGLSVVIVSFGVGIQSVVRTRTGALIYRGIHGRENTQNVPWNRAPGPRKCPTSPAILGGSV